MLDLLQIVIPPPHMIRHLKFISSRQKNYSHCSFEVVKANQLYFSVQFSNPAWTPFELDVDLVELKVC